MASVLASQPTDIRPPAPQSRQQKAMPPHQEPTPPENIKQEDDLERGRTRTRSRSDDKDAEGLDLEEDGDGDGAGDGAHSSNSEGPARKRRRSRKGLDKKFECPEKGCGKSYSRAEHLYRHQLNHNPKQVYKCGIGDCQRTFVRLDLCNRHKDRHTARGSTLGRKDSLISQMSPINDSHRPHFPAGSASPEMNRPGSAYNKAPPRQLTMQYQSPKDAMGSPYSPMTSTPPTGYPAATPNGVDYMHHDHSYGHMAQRPPHHSPAGPQRPAIQTNVGPYGVLSPISNQPGYHNQTASTPQSASGMPYVPPQNFPPFSLPPSEFPAAASPAVARDEQPNYVPATSAEYTDQQPQSGGEMMLLDQMGMTQTMPVFGSDSILNKSPYVGMPEDFVAYLFNTGHGDAGSPMTGVPMQGYNYGEFSNPYSVPYYNDPNNMGYFPAAATSHQVMSVTSLLDQNLPESVISEEKSNEIFEFIKERFHENNHAPIERQRDGLVEGDRNDDTHMLSRKMMQAYIGSYWLHFSDQVPILHKPTFSPDKVPNLLLIAMMTIGAACLDKAHGAKVTKAGAQLSNFLAWHLRWEMFQDPNCRPPAKLWVFQTLLLLELYEKMYSTRELHERAHIHHATTITLMRRGRALIGKSALDSPPNPRDDKTNGSRQSSTSGMAHTPAEWWNHWVTNETTRRAAFAAFVIDSTHATMFGHSTVMVAHEMRLPLPCDDRLWKATSGAEVGRIESQLLSVGNKPVSFLDGLKRTLSGQEVQTNSFGRTILMAGLLSVGWHLNQRDLQMNSLGGVSQALGGRDKWRNTLRRAFDNWKNDFDTTLARRSESATDPYNYEGSDRNVVFESRIVLHHLAHMAMHVDIVDCQIFARAKRLLGRAIGSQDLTSVQRRMREIWAPSAKARDAVYYALKFLTSVLLVDRVAGTPGSNGYPRHEYELYSARDDVLLNRPWVLYFAALVVWCYGFALEGPCPEAQVAPDQQGRVRQMREYLHKYGSISAPSDLQTMKGISHNTPLLTILKDAFEVTRWELLHEGANLLTNCIHLNAGQIM